ncbi:MAG: 30S ribosomal protein S20 [Caldiserica bacterium]|nr:30S ribosomal protein S20 [Caldisericota bacterium]MDH7561906.1 30S ribosomal protein S20 [Caldisericota bacterium]
MPRSKSAIKRERLTKKRTERNRSLESKLKTTVKKAQKAIVMKEEDSPQIVREACRTIDKMVTKGILHKNAAARKKSRLMKKVS